MLQSLSQVYACALRSSTPVLSGIMPGSAAAATCLCVYHSVPERATYGTEYACRAQKCFLGYATHFQKASVLKTGFYGTEEIFGAKNSLLWYATHLQRPAEQPTPQTVDRLLPHRAHFQRRAVPKAASCRTGRIFSARNSPREEVIRLKRG